MGRSDVEELRHEPLVGRCLAPPLVELPAIALIALAVGCAPAAVGADSAIEQRVTTDPITVVLALTPTPKTGPNHDPVTATPRDVSDNGSDEPANGDASGVGESTPPALQGGRRCPPWSTCELEAVFATNRDLFKPCARLAGLSGDDNRAVGFFTRATIGRDGSVVAVGIERLAPAPKGLEACLIHALRELPFALEGSDMTTTLEVEVKIVGRPPP